MPLNGAAPVIIRYPLEYTNTEAIQLETQWTKTLSKQPTHIDTP